jgi:hypothetical protein
MKKVSLIVAAAFALAGAAPAVAHDGLGDWDVQPYCGYGDGGFKTVHAFPGGVEFDRYQGTRVVTPGAPGSQPRWHAVYHVYGHFWFGYWGSTERLCRWAYW